MPISQAILDALSLFWRRRRLLLAVFLLLGLPAFAVIVLTPPRYAARTTLLAKFGREYAFRTDTAGNVLVPSNFGQDEIVNSVLEILRSDAVIDATVERIGPLNLYPELAEYLPPGTSLEDAAAARFAQSLTMAPARRSNVIAIDFAHTDPVAAASALNAYVEAFQTKYLSIYGESRTALLEAGEAQARRELQAVQAETVAYERQQKAYEKDGQMEALVRRKGELDTQLARVVACCSGTSSAVDLGRQVADLDARIAALNASQSTIRELARRRELAQENLDGAVRRLQEARNSKSMDDSRMTSVQVLDKATPPSRPTRLGRTVKLILAMILVGVVGMVAAFLAEVFSRRFSTAGQVRRAFSVPILAEVPYWKPAKAQG